MAEPLVDPDDMPDVLCPFYKQKGSGICAECGRTFAEHVEKAREYDQEADFGQNAQGENAGRLRNL